MLNHIVQGQCIFYSNDFFFADEWSTCFPMWKSRDVVYGVVLRFALVFFHGGDRNNRRYFRGTSQFRISLTGTAGPANIILAKFPWRELMRSSEPEVDNESVNIKNCAGYFCVGGSARSFYA